MAFSFRAQSLMLVPDFDGAEHWARRAIEVAEATGATTALMHAYNNLGTSLMGMADASGIEYLRRSRDLAIEHHLPDEVGRANTNLASQGSRILPMRYEEMDQHLVEGMDFSRRTIPDGIFDRWIRTARGEFLMVSARWEEADQVLSGLDAEQLRGLPQLRDPQPARPALRLPRPDDEAAGRRRRRRRRHGAAHWRSAGGPPGARRAGDPDRHRGRRRSGREPAAGHRAAGRSSRPSSAPGSPSKRPIP